MVGPQTREALNKRARSASVVMKEAAAVLQRALDEQRPPKPARLTFLAGERIPETVTLPGRAIDNMIANLYHWAYEIDRFSWPK